jgi:hypothetical protein
MGIQGDLNMRPILLACYQDILIWGNRPDLLRFIALSGYSFSYNLHGIVEMKGYVIVELCLNKSVTRSGLTCCDIDCFRTAAN